VTDHNTPIRTYGAARMAAVPIHSAIVISKVKTRLTALSMVHYVNGHSHCAELICVCLTGLIR
jgi:hypothetical protein